MGGRRGPRLVLAAGIIAGAYTLPDMWLERPGMLASNYDVYRVAVRAWLEGGQIYEVTPPDHGSFRYLYPPIALVGLLPLAGVPWRLPGFALHTLLQIGAGAGCGWLAVRTVERHGRELARLDRVLLVGYGAGSIHSVPSLYFGNVNLAMALGIAAVPTLLERDAERAAGVALAIAALPKVFPAAVGAWFLRRRNWGAVAGSVATGLALVVASLLLFGPDRHVTYVRRGLLSRVDALEYAGGMEVSAPYVTVRRPLSVAFPDAGQLPVAIAAVVVVAPVVVWLLGDLETPLDRLVGLHGLLTGILVALPSYFVYFVVLYATTLPLAYLLEARARGLFLAGIAVATVALTGDTIVAGLQARPLPAWLVAPLGDVLLEVFRFASPLLYGATLMLLGCCVRRWHAGGRD